MPRETIEKYRPSIEFMTLSEFEQLILIDFTSYLSSLKADFESDLVSQYYVQARTSDRRRLHEEVVLPWISDDSASSLAIIAGYGMGKTSYARYLAHYLSIAALLKYSSRIPIYLPLGNLTQHQSLRTLINSLFADDFRLKGYNYQLFDQLNRAGRFLLICDGFDEMKHAMKPRDIVENFRDIGRLRHPNTKLLLLGRPDPFQTEEDAAVIMGERLIKGNYHVDPEREKYERVTLDYFSEEELQYYFNGFLTAYVKTNTTKYLNPQKFLRERIAELNKIRVTDMVRRPVHAKMLADLSIIETHSIENYNEYDLYKNFITKTIERESDKAARKAVPESTRFEFMLRVAWWLWTVKKQNMFSPDELPKELNDFVISHCDEHTDVGTAIREFITGSILEHSKPLLLDSKKGIFFYFPHRSYLEFLVSEYLCSNLATKHDITAVGELINAEITKFIIQRRDLESIDLLLSKMVALRAKFSSSILDIIACAPSLENLNYSELKFGANDWWRLGAITEKLLSSIKFDLNNFQAFLNTMVSRLSREHHAVLVSTITISVYRKRLPAEFLAYLILSNLGTTVEASDLIPRRVSGDGRSFELYNSIFGRSFSYEVGTSSWHLNLETVLNRIKLQLSDELSISKPSDVAGDRVLFSYDEVLSFARDVTERREISRLLRTLRPKEIRTPPGRLQKGNARKPKL